MNALDYFWLFFKASLLSTGGSGNLPFLHRDLLALGWATDADFVTALAVGQISPGPSGLWSVSLGYLTFGWPGAALALMALALPPLLVLGTAAGYRRLEMHPVMQNFTRGFTLGVVGLTLAVAWALGRATISDWRGVAIMLGVLGLALSQRVPVILLLALGALAGWLLYRS